MDLTLSLLVHTLPASRPVVRILEDSVNFVLGERILGLGLQGQVEPSKSSYNVTSRQIEVTLRKKVSQPWSHLLANADRKTFRNQCKQDFSRFQDLEDDAEPEEQPDWIDEFNNRRRGSPPAFDQAWPGFQESDGTEESEDSEDDLGDPGDPGDFADLEENNADEQAAAIACGEEKNGEMGPPQAELGMDQAIVPGGAVGVEGVEGAPIETVPLA